jgi:hypothetical protein
MLRKSWQEKVGLFDETLRSYEDWDLWLRLVKIGLYDWQPLSSRSRSTGFIPPR